MTVDTGELNFEGADAAAVFYRLDGTRGRVIHAEGHPHWHPIVALHAGPFTLKTRDGRKLKVALLNLRGDFQVV